MGCSACSRHTAIKNGYVTRAFRSEEEAMTWLAFHQE